ncbi:MAG: hypothetical protein R3F07_07765 [Opitutaceae bacterium]
MLTEILKEIDHQKSKLEALGQSMLENLHSMLGYESRSDLIKKLQGLGAPKKATRTKRKAAARSSSRKAPKAAKKAPAKAAKKAPAKKAARKAGGRRKRTTITPEIRDGVIAAVKGGATSGAVAAQFGVSVPTVQNIKKAAGLTKKS